MISADTPPAGTSAAPKVDPAAEKFWQASKVLWSKVPAEQEAGRTLLVESAELEFPAAQLLLGECYQGGSLGFKKDLKKGASLFRLAAERGNAFAKVSYGVCLFAGLGVRKDADKDIEWLTAAVAPDADYSRPQPPVDFKPVASAGGDDDSGLAGTVVTDPVATAQARAHFVLGVLLEQQKKMPEAQAHYVAAATAGPGGREGIQAAAVQAAVNYAFGNGVPRDSARANEMLEQSRKLVRRAAISTVHDFANQKLVDDFAVSELEDAVAEASNTAATETQFQIAERLADRKAKEYNPAEAVRWYELAAESKKSWAMLELGFLYARGDLGTPDYAKAFTWFEKAGAKDAGNHLLGVANTAICLQNGIGTTADPARAAILYKKHRDDDIVCYLGTIGHCPTAIVTFEEEVALNERWARKKKDAHAQYLLGMRYTHSDWGEKQDEDDAERWWKRAARAHSASACRELGGLYEGRGDMDKALEFYREGMKLGDAQCPASLGYMYEFGRGVRADENEAVRYYETGLEMNPASLMAQNNLGTIYEARFRHDREIHDEARGATDRAKMLELLEKADAGGSAYAAYNLGLIYYDGVLGRKDFMQAYTCFEKAAERGHVVARYRLGLMHEMGEGVDVTYSEAAYHYRLAALDGNVDALRRLILFYVEGKGVSQDFDRAEFWLLRLVKLGRVDALTTLVDIELQKGSYKDAVKMLNNLRDYPDKSISGFAFDRLSRCYQFGWGVKPWPERSEAYLEKAVNLGDPDAEYRKAQNLMAAKRTAEAIPLFEKAAAGSPDACYSLGQMRFFGQFMEKDLKQAWDYLRRAAERNQRDALYFLAGTTINKVPGAPSLDEAIRFAEAAEHAGHPKAAALRELLEKRRQAQQSHPESDTGSRST